MTPTEERILNLVIEWSMTHYLVARALIEAQLQSEAKVLVKERREAEVENGEKAKEK